MKRHPICPYAKHDGNMHLRCKPTGKMCAYQRWCLMEGRSVLIEGAPGCLERERLDKQGGKDNATAG